MSDSGLVPDGELWRFDHTGAQDKGVLVVPRVAVVHDYLTQRGGAERVVLAMLRCYPDAVLHTTIYNPETTYADFSRYDVRTTALNRFPAFRRDPRRALPFLPQAIASMDVSDADVVLASTSGWAHGVHSTAPVVAYCHTPARWLYEPADYFRGMPPALGAAFGCVRPALRRWDSRGARRVGLYLANSSVVARRIERAYGLAPEVVHPPSTLTDEGPVEPVKGLEPGFFLTVGRRRGYKNTDRVCAAVEDHTDERLVVVGEALGGHRRFSDRVVALPPVTDPQLRWLYRSCRGLVAMSFEDFGLAPLEAFFFGRPVVALRAGGYLDSCVDGVTGVFVDDVDPRTIAAGIQQVRARTWDAQRIRKHAARFHIDRFGDDLDRVVSKAVVAQLVRRLPRQTSRGAALDALAPAGLHSDSSSPLRRVIEEMA